MKRMVSMTALVLVFALGGCDVTDVGEAAFSGSGVVTFVAVEGGCWTIDAGAEQYEPINLAAAFRVDGLVVTFEADDRPDLASICQVGRLVEIRSIDVPGN
jgi:hypothetical protein